MKKKELINNIDYSFIYNPYFVALGNVFQNLENPDFILVGYSSQYSLRKIKNIYKKIYKNLIIRDMTLQEAELVKLLVNCKAVIDLPEFLENMFNKRFMKNSSK